MAHDSKVVRLAGHKPVSRFTLPTALVRLRDTAGQELKAVLVSFFEQADDSLFSLADRAGSNTDQSAYFDAMRELRLRRKAIALSVLQYVGQAFNELGRFKPVRSGGSLEEVNQDTFSLMEHSELEEQVAIESLTNRLGNRHQEQIRMLAARVRHLVPGLELSDDQIPLSPEVICGSIAEACSDLDIDIRAKLVVLKLFERLLTDKLDHFYRQCNQALVSEGVLPGMKNAPVGRAPMPAQPVRSPVAPAGTGLEAAPDPATSAEAGSSLASATFNELSALLRQGADAGIVSQPAVGSNVLDTGRLLARLNELQATSGGESVADQVMPLREQLQPVLQPAEGSGVALAQVDSDVINLVGMLFDFILDDRQLHPVMKSLIGRLQIPVLKVALSDRNFFNRGGHPVRKLLNELALAAIGWNEKRPGMRDPEEGRARQERASQAAKDLMLEQTEGRDIPEAIRTLLDGPCTRYLQWIMLRQGEDSLQWQDACELVSRLIWTVDPSPVSGSTRAELLRTIPGVVEGLRAALKEISWDPFATDSAVRDLELAHVDAFQKLVVAPAEVEPVPAAEPAEVAEIQALEPAPAPQADAEAETELARMPEPVVEAEPEVLGQQEPEQGPMVSEEWLVRADNMRVGSWVELQRDDDTRLRCKLAAFIKATGKYIFVNRSGAKVAEYQREGLAAAMQAGGISMLDDGLIFDRALESIIDNLRYSRKD